MSSYHPLRQSQTRNYDGSSGPERTLSNHSNSSSAYSAYSNPFPPSRTSTVSSMASSAYSNASGTRAGHKRGISEATGSVPLTGLDHRLGGNEVSPAAGAYKSIRQSLRPLPQVPSPIPVPAKANQLSNAPPPYKLSSQPSSPTPPPRRPAASAIAPATSPCDERAIRPSAHSRALSTGRDITPKARPHSIALGRSDSIKPSGLGRTDSIIRSSFRQPAAHLTAPDFDSLQRSSTAQLRTLCTIAGKDVGQDFAINSPAQEVAGLHGRRRLQCADPSRRGRGTVGSSGSTYNWERNWMDKQRQFLQAYEYLCHIGEAKEWIENVIDKDIPPIVQLEEALRNGVTLAEIVQGIQPDQPVRIFHSPKLQYRHSDNIAIFFRFLADMDLPELFRFEFVDLYEKKNIPKVIYCIHALSWLLFRKGVVDFRIGNLVGQLEFAHHELEEMQKGLDKAGVSMPSFSGMGASFGAEPEPEPEPVETEQERVDRELGEHAGMVLDLQAQMRGAVVRLRLGRDMQRLWAAETMLLDLQSRLRGEWARQVSGYRLSMRTFAITLQAATRGYLGRSRQKSDQRYWSRQQHEVITLQSLVRARKAREKVQLLRTELRREEPGVRSFQAAVKGAFHRQRFAAQARQVQHTSKAIAELQAATRGQLLRARLAGDEKLLAGQAIAVKGLQSAARGLSLRKHMADTVNALHEKTGLWRALQAVARGRSARQSTARLRERLDGEVATLRQLQAAIRGSEVRTEVDATKAELAVHELEIVLLQSKTRAMLQRRTLSHQAEALRAQTSVITRIQATSRGCLLRRQNHAMLSVLRSHTPGLVVLQGLGRAMLRRGRVTDLLAQIEAEEESIVEVQAAAQGMLVRARYAEKQRYFKQNMEKVVKLQSFVRGRIQGEAYKSLTSGKNPPVGTLKGFVHLLNDSDFDFDEEIEFERLRKTVVQHVRQNELAEQYIDQLDIKIALLVKNKITLDEVVKHQKHFGGHVGSLLTNTEMSSKDPFDLKALNKNSRQKLEHYQQLFFVLQTQPQYLARLFKAVREKATPEKDCKRIENLTMSLFGYAQKRREEYYLLKLIVRSIREEIEACDNVQDYLRGNFFWTKLLSGYIRSPRDRRYMRDLLGPLVRENILENPELDLESDPMQIYRSAINNEELRTGRRSQRRPDISREDAIKDPETRKTFTDHLQDLRDIADQFLAALEEFMHKMPYGIRHVTQQIFRALRDRFPHEDQQYLAQLVGHWLWRSYFQPAITQPETFGVVDRPLMPLQKRNMGEVAKVLSQVAVGRLFGGENVFLQPLNSYVSESILTMGEIWHEVMSVPDAEAQFDIDAFNDLYARAKPTLYIKMADIFAIHHLIAADIGAICVSKDDILREVVHELGSAKNNESEMMGLSSTEISLTLSPKLHDVEDPDAESKALFMETKRCILYIIRIQAGPNLMDILVTPITAEDEDRWHALLQDEFAAGSKKRAAYSDASTLVDITSISYAELKRTALENIVRLEQCGKLTRHNHYQDLLNAIAVDIRTKHRRRIQRQRELEGVRLTLGNLNEKTVWLEQQLQSYNHYIEQAMVTLQNKKGKKRFLLPFTKQYNHERELQRSGRIPKFGSFKYSARTLADKGVLVSYTGYAEKAYDKINLTISSDAVGVFFLEGSVGSIQIPGASAQLPLDDLLQAQFNNHQFMTLFEGQMKLNVNLFLHLVFRKFYRDE